MFVDNLQFRLFIYFEPHNQQIVKYKKGREGRLVTICGLDTHRYSIYHSDQMRVILQYLLHCTLIK